MVVAEWVCTLAESAGARVLIDAALESRVLTLVLAVGPIYCQC